MTVFAAAFQLCACKSLQNFGDVTSSISGQEMLPRDPAALREYSATWGARYEAAPDNKDTAIRYARSLRALDQNEQAVAILQNLALKNPKDLDVLGEYGRALANAGRLREAADVLSRAHHPEMPNWRILSVQGTVADQLGDHVQAQNYYSAALKIMPNEPSVLSNLGLSQALAKNLPEAEQTFRLAIAQPDADVRVRQNFALILALEGKFKEAEALSEQDLSPQDAARNIEAIRTMIAQSNTWKEIQQGSKTGKKS